MIDQHLVQKTCARLILQYGSHLCHRDCHGWTDGPEPPKHVVQDLTIVAILIELWRGLYGVKPALEKEQRTNQLQGAATSSSKEAPGRFSFVDVACGNGVVVYVLLMEGYDGFGIDVCGRRSWSTYPQRVQDRLRKAIYVPKPFVDAMSGVNATTNSLDLGIEVVTCTGMFSMNTFIISNHADELTVWTPLMATLANPVSPLPFLAIPCCSHSLTGAPYWYPPPSRKPIGLDDATRGSPPRKKDEETSKQAEENENEELERNPQPASGDLKKLRASKMAAMAAQINLAVPSPSRYACLTAKTVSISEELGYSIHTSQVQLPSLRNTVIVGVRRQQSSLSSSSKEASPRDEGESLSDTALAIVQRECEREGGIEEAAKIWIERVKEFHMKNYNSGGGSGNEMASMGLWRRDIEV
ncbi:putative AdoMet-dependent methyltransferase domain containing protein [Elaphomyces granulatus]